MTVEQPRLQPTEEGSVSHCDTGLASGARRARRAWFCVILAMILPFCGAVFYFAILKQSAIAKVLYACVKVFTVVWPVIAIWGIGLRREPRSHDIPNRHFRALPLGMVSGIVIGGFIIAVLNVGPLHEYMAQAVPRLRERLEFFGIHSMASYLAWCGFLAILHSLIEEFFWRWFVFETLLTLVSRPVAYLLASLSFALHHYVICWQYVPPLAALVFGTSVGVGGLIWCWMVDRQKTLVGAWLSHALVDIAIFIVGYQLLFA